MIFAALIQSFYSSGSNYGPSRYWESNTSLATKVSHEMQNEGVYVVFIDVYGQYTFDDVSKEALKVIYGSINTDSKESLRKWVTNRTSPTLLVFVKCDEWLKANDGHLGEIKHLQDQSQVVKYILTSRYKVFDMEKFRLHKIGSLEDHAAHDLLGKLTSRLKQEDKVKIAILTGNHPLALEVIGALFNREELSPPHVLIEDLETKLIKTLYDPIFSTEERLCMLIKVAIHYTSPNLQLIAQNLSHYPGTFDEQSALEIVFNLSGLEASQSPERKEYLSQLKALQQLLLLKYNHRTNRYRLSHYMIRDCLASEENYSNNILFFTRFQHHYSQRLLDASLSHTPVDEEMHNFQHMFQMFSSVNCTFYYPTTLTAMKKIFEAITSDFLR